MQDWERGDTYDVAILGGGLAGLTLALQLRKMMPDLSVAVIERTTRPLPEAAHKVGESTVCVGAHYLGEMVGLKAYLEARHLRKLGLRFFVGRAHGRFEDRPEIGDPLFGPVPSYQIDRGRFENDLRGMVEKEGVTLLEGWLVKDVSLSGTEEAPKDDAHRVEIRAKEGDARRCVEARWVVDATGRRRLLQAKLGFKRACAHRAGAAWWRVKGRLDVDDLVPEGVSWWHGRSVEDRFYSTNHITGHGYWVWLIPLSSGMTSVGIVADETIHPFRGFGTSHEVAMAWLREHEPRLWEAFKAKAPIDFLALRRYAFWSEKIFSARRWSCVGEAGVFLDPFYSPGTDFIGMSNTITATMIRLDRQNELTPSIADKYNKLYLDVLGPTTLSLYKGTYSTFGHARVFGAKYFWDTALYWGINAKLMFSRLIERPDLLDETIALLSKYRMLAERTQAMFIDYAAKTSEEGGWRVLGLSDLPLFRYYHFRLLNPGSPEESLQEGWQNLKILEGLTLLFFQKAVQDCLPDRFDAVRDYAGLNPYAVGLDPDAWERDGLFNPAARPFDADRLRALVPIPATAPPLAARLSRDAARRFATLWRGKPAYAAARVLQEVFSRELPVRALFVGDVPIASLRPLHMVRRIGSL